jgi:hypothetical protein
VIKNTAPNVREHRTRNQCSAPDARRNKKELACAWPREPSGADLRNGKNLSKLLGGRQNPHT